MERRSSIIKQNKSFNNQKAPKSYNQSVRSQINPNFFKQQQNLSQNENLLCFDIREKQQVENIDSQLLQCSSFDQDQNKVNQTSIKTVTSEKPLKLAWIFDQNDLVNFKFKQQFKDNQQIISKFALSQCPGKKIERGRDGKKHDRDIYRDVENYKNQGITLIVCLLNDSELRSLGVKVQDYQKACEIQGIQLFKYPIIEMAPPDDLEKFHSEVVQTTVNHILSGNGNALIHCRGGVGRAGLLGCCILANICEFTNFKKIIEFMRKRRDKRCVESRKQEDFVQAYFKYINQNE